MTVIIYSKEFNKVSQNFIANDFSFSALKSTNLTKVYAAWILVLKFGLDVKALSRGNIVCREKIIYDYERTLFSRRFERATQEFHEIFGLLLSRLSIIIFKILSKSS